MHGLDQRARHTNRKIKSWRLQRAVVGIEKIVKHIDATTKCHAPVDHAQLPVQTPPAARNQHAQIAQRGKDRPFNSRRIKTGRPGGRNAWCANTVHGQIDGHAALRRTLQSRSDLQSRGFHVEDIGLHADFMDAAINGLHQGRKKGLPTLQQHKLVACTKLLHDLFTPPQAERIPLSVAGDPTCATRCAPAEHALPAVSNLWHRHSPVAPMATGLGRSFDWLR